MFLPISVVVRQGGKSKVAKQLVRTTAVYAADFVSGSTSERTTFYTSTKVEMASDKLKYDYPKPHHDTSVALKNIGKSVGVLTAGAATLGVMPDVGLLIDFVAGFAATLSMQPLVNTKLAAQRSEEKLNLDDPFLKREYQLWKQHFMDIIHSDSAHSGGVSYAGRGALTKALMFFGFDSVDGMLAHKATSLPTAVRQAISGGVSGGIQGTIVAFPEWFSTQRSLHAEKTSKESVADIKEYVKAHGARLPVASTTARNSVFDSVFNVLKENGVPYGPAAVVSMSGSYLFEKSRSLSQQSKTPEEVGTFFKEKFSSGKECAEDVFKGWGSKAMEFVLVYFLLQSLKSFKAWLSGDKKAEPDKVSELRQPEKA